MRKYSYFYCFGTNKVVCVASFAGKVVRGVAKCNTDYDKFNIEIGKALAKMRCDVKIANKRLELAKSRLNNAETDYENAKKFKALREQRYNEVFEELEAAKLNLAEFECQLA